MTEDTRIDGGAPGPAGTETSDAPGPVEDAVTRGRSAGTPFVLLGGVALTIWTVVALVAAVLLLLWWLG